MTIAATTHCHQKQVGKQRVYLAHASTLVFITEGSQDTGQEPGADAEAMQGAAD